VLAEALYCSLCVGLLDLNTPIALPAGNWNEAIAELASAGLVEVRP
jgi:hypothetical protein